MMSDTLCKAPWTHLHTWPNDDVYPCCLTDMKDTVGNLKENTLEEIWNNDKMQKLRAEMLEGKRPASCSRCFEQEDAGQFSFRHHMNREFEHHKSESITPDLNLVYWDFRFSNICNFKCRSCGPQLSTGWYDDTKKLGGELPHDIPDGKNLQLWEQIEPLFDTVEDIYFAGGEPLIMEEHYRILKKLDEMQRYDVVIRYNSNFSQLKFKSLDVLDIWPKFDKVVMGASVDGMGDKGEYIRKGLKWSQFVDNRNRMKEKSPKTEFFVNCTVSIQNAFHVVPFHRHLVREKLIDYPDNFRVNLVQHPEHLRIQVLDSEKKKRLTEMYYNHALWLKSHNQELAYNDFMSLINFMNSQDMSHMYTHFRNEMKKLDEIRNESFEDTFPELL